MRSKLARPCFLAAMALAMALPSRAYVHMSTDSTWLPGPIPMQIKVGAPSVLSDGSNYQNVAQDAMNIWNGYLGAVQFQPLIGAVGPGSFGNDANEIYFNGTVEGDAFGTGVLAVTLVSTYASVNQTSEADIIFNSAYTWDSYRGNLQTAEDFQRVLLHELGHVLGLDHPDEHGQSVTALMNANVSDLDHLAPDDIAGAQSLYRAPGQTAPPANDNFVNATAISLVSGTAQVAGDSYYATLEVGEPDHDPGDGVGGASVWWKWTAPHNGPMIVTTEHSHFDTLLGVYTGSAVNALATVGVNDDTSADPHLQYSTVTFTATAGITYYFAVDGWKDPDTPGAVAASGLIKLNLNFTSTDAGPYLGNQPPYSTLANLGSTVQLAVEVHGSPPPSLQWQRLPAGETTAWTDLTDGGAYSGTHAATLTIQVTDMALDGSSYRLVASNSSGTITTSSCKLVVNGPPDIRTQPKDITLYATEAGSIGVGVTSNTALSYQWYHDGVSLGAAGRGNSLHFSSLSSVDAGSYYVEVTNTYSTVRSDAVTVTVNPLAGVVRVRSGKSSTVFERTDGSWWLTGNNVLELGTGYPLDDYLTRPLPISRSFVVGQLPSQPVVVALGDTAGAQFQVFLLADGQLWCNGLALRSQVTGGLPAAYPYLLAENVSAVAAGIDHLLFLKTDGSLWAAGKNQGGVLGDGTTAYRDTPVMVATGVVSVSTYYQQTMFVKYDGTLWTMGGNFQGVLGDGTTVDRLTPVQIAAQVHRSFVGRGTSFYVKQDGTLWGAGSNSFGELGDGGTAWRSVPVQVAADVLAAISANGSSLYLKTDGTLWGMGQNLNGELLNGSTTAQPNPIQIATEVVGFSTAEGNSFMIKSDGSLRAAGLNLSGQLGIGTATSTAVVTQVTSGIPQAPGSPAGLTATTGTLAGLVRLNWQNTAGATSYEVWRGTGAGFSSATMIADQVENPIYFDQGTTAGVTYYYWVKAANYAGVSAASAAATGVSQAASLPSITTPPANATAASGGSVTFTVAADAGFAPAYQWQRLPAGASQWAAFISNTPAYSGVFSATLTISQISADMNGDQFRCVVTGPGGSVTSPAATLTVTITAPVITTQPASLALAAGAPATFAVVDQSYAPTTYQWYHDGVAIPDVAGSTLTIASVQAADAGSYTVAVSNAGGTVTSAPAILTLATGSESTPVITSQPQNMSVAASPEGWALFTVSANGDPSPTYQWQIRGPGANEWQDVGDGANYSGTSTPTFGIMANSAFSGYQVHCVVTNAAGSVISESATLQVLSVYKSQTIIFAGPADQPYTAASLTLSATASSGLPVTFAVVSGPATLTGSQLTFTGVGTVTVRATQTGNGTYIAANPVDHSFTVQATGTTRMDLNADGQTDILWRYQPTGEVGVWLMNGTSPTGYRAISTVNSDYVLSGTGDFNGDGQTDILWRYQPTGEVGVWLMNGASVTSYQAIQTVNSDYVLSGTGDFNGDGQTDILWRYQPTGEVGVWLMNGTTVTGYHVISTVNSDYVLSGTGDFNGDGQTDILWRYQPTGEVGVWLMNGLTVTSYQVIHSLDRHYEIRGEGDYDGDGQTDILLRYPATGEVGVWLMHGTSVTGYHAIQTVNSDYVLAGNGAPAVRRSAAQLDLNGDGQTDILWRNQDTGQAVVWLMHGTALDHYAALPAPSLDYRLSGWGDFNGDGQEDLLWRHSGGEVGVWLMDGTTVKSYQVLGWVNPAYTLVGMGDFNGDGQRDILWRLASGELGVWLMNGTNVSSYQVIANVDPAYKLVGTGDFNGDGQTDILWRHTATGEVGLWVMHGLTVDHYESLGTVNPDYVITGTGDYNGDGQEDILWRHTPDGELGLWVMHGTQPTSYQHIDTVPTAWQVAQ